MMYQKVLFPLILMTMALSQMTFAAEDKATLSYFYFDG
ncbi:MAG: hypothetical protein ACI9TH_001033 [Kiritimatiellia bacterium]|jgi:hypothetical protein